jgi:hypothetical protein
LLRDRPAAGEDGGKIEAFMMVRHYEIDFASGALVFPGGSIESGDHEIITHGGLCSGGEGLDQGELSFPDRRDPRDVRGKRNPACACWRIERSH